MGDAHSGQAERQTRRVSQTAILMVGTAGLLLAAASLFSPSPALIWNVSESVPAGLYRFEAKQPERGDIAVIRPAGALALALKRAGVLPEGRLMLKPLTGLPGQVICRTGGAVTLDNAPIAIARTHTRRGEALPAWSGCRRLLPGERVVLAQNPASFDSRYFGPIEASQIIGRARPLLAFLPSGSEP